MEIIRKMACYNFFLFNLFFTVLPDKLHAFQGGLEISLADKFLEKARKLGESNQSDRSIYYYQRAKDSVPFSECINLKYD